MKKTKQVMLAAMLFAWACAPSIPTVEILSVEQITTGPKNHYFGYYGMNVWNADQTKILAMEVDFNDRLPVPGEKAVIGLVDIADKTFTPLTETSAWNLQQGCMLHWNPLNPSDQFYHNEMVDGKLASILYTISTGEKQVMPYTISGMSDDGRYAVHMNYGRISRLRKVVSYPGTEDPNPTVAHPDNDGVFIFDLQSGEARLLVSYKQMADQIAKTVPEIADRHMWTEHAVISRTGKKVLFLPRSWNADTTALETGLFVINIDGTDMKEIVPYGSSVSHFGWKDDDHIVVTYNFDGKSRSHVLVNDLGEPFEQIGQFLWDGHCSTDHTGQWLLTDGNKGTTEEEGFSNNVWLYNFKSQETFLVNKFDMVYKRYLGGDARCDLHPRISKDNSKICADAVDPATGLRQIFMINVKLRN